MRNVETRTLWQMLAFPALGVDLPPRNRDRLNARFPASINATRSAAGLAMHSWTWAMPPHSVVAPAPGTNQKQAVSVRTITSKVLELDSWDHQITLQVSDVRTIAVKVLDMVNFADLQPGDIVTIQITEARTFQSRNALAPANRTTKRRYVALHSSP